jgi:hypothetical protein
MNFFLHPDDFSLEILFGILHNIILGAARFKISNKMKKNMLLNLLFAAGSLISCNSDALLEPEMPEYSIVQGDTVKTRTSKLPTFKFCNIESAPLNVVGDTVVMYNPSWRLEKPARLPKLDKIKVNDDPELKGKPYRIFAYGEGFLSGYRDGGLFNEGMLTSLPNLLANQMGVEINLPLFDKDDYNGFDRRVPTSFNPTGGPVTKFKLASNNNGVEYVDEKSRMAFLKKSKTERLDNYAFPNTETTIPGEENQIKGRIYPRDWDGAYTAVIKNKADFYIIQDVFEGAFGSFLSLKPHNGGYFGPPEIKGINGITSKDINPWYPTAWVNTRILLYIHIKESKNLKYGVILNTPDYTDFPYLNQVKPEEVIKTLEKYGAGYPSTKFSHILPSSEIDSLLGTRVHPNLKRGLRPEFPLNPRNFVEKRTTDYNKTSIPLTNQETAALAKEFGFAVVDVYTIYKEIHKGSYQSPDGMRVSVEDFYSTDGVYPSSFGQAVMTNETIKAINKHYGLEIPYVNTRMFLQK